MNQEETSSGLSVKRRRGRPPKDPSLKRIPNGPKQYQHPPAGPTEPSVGQAVTGVVEDTLDSGYILNVRIGNSPMSFRGIVFKPGHYVPVTADNDMAPQLQMVERNDLYTPRRRKYTSRRAATVSAPPVVHLDGSPEPGQAGWILGLGGKDVHMVEPLSMLPLDKPISDGQVLLPELPEKEERVGLSDVEKEGSSESSDGDELLKYSNSLPHEDGKEGDVSLSNETKPLFDSGPGKMTDLLQAVPGSEFGQCERITTTTTEADPRNEASGL